jgi:uroporphyrinogen III methyltransferase/synthase
VTVYLVGAGPGGSAGRDRRGEELLRRAEVVVYDRLASRALLDLAPPGAELVDAGKSPAGVALTQEQINQLLVDRGRADQEVVRLKGGDPFVFGRGGEEAEACRAAGVPFEVVPGVTSAIAAPAYAGIPVTHRGVSTSVTFVTGHEDPTKPGTDTDWNALARAGGTLVVLMGAGNVREIARVLVDGGRAPATPVAAVRWGTRPEQRTLRGTLATIADLGIEAPSAIVVGEVAALDLGWFEQRPLFGRRVVITRAREQASALRARLEELGAEVIELPSIAVEPVAFELPELSKYAWLVFTSVNGVDAFFERGLAAAGLDTRALGGARVAAIGPGTSNALAQRGIRADLVPERFVAESLVAAFPDPESAGERVLIARAESARDVLPTGLTAGGYVVDVLGVYRTVPVEPDPADVARVRAGDVDLVTFTSSSTVTNFCDVVGPDAAPLRVVSIGPITSAMARERGLTVGAEADPHTIDGLVDAVCAVLVRSG